MIFMKYLLYIPLLPIVLPVVLFYLIVIPIGVLYKNYKTRKLMKKFSNL